MSSSSSSIKDEIDVVKAKLPDIQIITATKDFVTVSYEKTPSRRVKATLTFPDGGYPNKDVGAIVDVTGVVPGLKKKWDKELTQLAKDNNNNNNNKAGTNNNNNPMIFVVLERLQQLVDTNRFVPCWRELKQSVELFQQEQNESSGKNKGSGTILSMNEAKGLIKLKMTNGKYHYTCNITIDEGYPTTLSIHDWGKACSIRTSSTNLPSSIESAVTKRCQEFVRHLQDGMPEKIARSKMGVTVASSSTSSSAKTNSNTKKSQQTATSSSPPSQPQGESDSDWKAQETARLSNYDVPTYDGSNPQPSLLPLVKFMVDTIQTLPQKVCPICDKPSFPTDPTMLASFFSTATKPSATPKEKKAALQRKRQRPMQPTSCGACWYHYQCLNEFLTQPPFGDGGCPAGHDHCSSNDKDDDNDKSTTTTKNTVTHPDWTASRQELEQAWAGKQARQREMDDVAMMF